MTGKCFGYDRALRQVIQRVVVSVLVVPLARPVPVVRSGFRNEAELSARGMPILRAELIRGEVEFRYRIRNDRRVVSRHAEVVVVHAVHRKVVVARTRSANRSADSRHSARLRYNVGRQHG